MLVSPNQIAPSQDFLKENTIRFIFSCLNDGKNDELPPSPLVRKDETGVFVAIDGHNLIAVRLFRGEDVEVVEATSSTDGLPPTSQANATRNQELAEKFDLVLEEQKRVAASGILSFADLIARYRSLFEELK